MSYITNSDIETRLGSAAYVQLTDDGGSGSANPDVVDEARRGAEGEVDSYLARRYAVPVDLTAHPNLSAVLTSVVLDLVEYRLHARRPPVPDVVTAKRDAAIDWLARVATGQVELPAAAPLASNPATGLRAATTGNPRILSREELDAF